MPSPNSESSVEDLKIELAASKYLLRRTNDAIQDAEAAALSPDTEYPSSEYLAIAEGLRAEAIEIEKVIQRLQAAITRLEN